VTNLEAFTIAESAKDFWKAVANPKKLTDIVGATFHEYLIRVLLHFLLRRKWRGF
jgi:hypothetical protein